MTPDVAPVLYGLAVTAAGDRARARREVGGEEGTMSKRSPGPWTVVSCIISDADGMIVCEPNREEDDRLIAAAPRMLELLRDIYFRGGSVTDDDMRAIGKLLAEIDEKEAT
jgi:hypothetical protein